MKRFYLTAMLPLASIFSAPVYACEVGQPSCCPPWRCGISNGVSSTGIKADVEAAIADAQVAADAATVLEQPKVESTSVKLESTVVERTAAR